MRPIGATVYMMPPYILSDEEIDGLAANTLAVFNQVMAG
jgi:adenosylmethionine-8-amino-7-oxononanoate aminotransferase